MGIDLVTGVLDTLPIYNLFTADHEFELLKDSVQTGARVRVRAHAESLVSRVAVDARRVAWKARGSLQMRTI